MNAGLIPMRLPIVVLPFLKIVLKHFAPKIIPVEPPVGVTIDPEDDKVIGSYHQKCLEHFEMLRDSFLETIDDALSGCPDDLKTKQYIFTAIFVSRQEWEDVLGIINNVRISMFQSEHFNEIPPCPLLEEEIAQYTLKEIEQQIVDDFQGLNKAPVILFLASMCLSNLLASLTQHDENKY